MVESAGLFIFAGLVVFTNDVIKAAILFGQPIRAFFFEFAERFFLILDFTHIISD
jgi:hypothetical protein